MALGLGVFVAVGGIAVAVGSGASLYIGESELSGNAALLGGAVYCADSSFVWINRSTIPDNRADEGSGVHSSSCELWLTRSIVAFGREGEAVRSSGDSLLFHLSDIYGNDGGDWVGPIEDLLGVDDNVSVDPLFCDPWLGDYSLAEASPCLELEMGAHGVGCESAIPPAPTGRLRLNQNYPNPFSPATQFALVLPEAGRVRLVVYDLRGRVVATILDEYRRPGELISRWDGLNDQGRPVAAGVYFARLEQAGHSDVRKVVVVR